MMISQGFAVHMQCRVWW